jgi:predicted DNA-binding transcriptional regulator AlpA
MQQKRLLPDPQVCERYSVTGMTLWRWDHDPNLGFPKAIRIRNRKYRDERELDEFDRRQAEVSSDAA